MCDYVFTQQVIQQSHVWFDEVSQLVTQVGYFAADAKLFVAIIELLRHDIDMQQSIFALEKVLESTTEVQLDILPPNVQVSCHFVPMLPAMHISGTLVCVM